MKMSVGSPQGLKIAHAIMLGSSAVTMNIQGAKPGEWEIRYQTDHGGPNRTMGTIIMTTIQLQVAFDLGYFLPGGDKVADRMIALYGGSEAVPGKFIRYERWLNIPCPGSGVDGDPNVSIELHDEIKDAVRRLIASRR